MNIVPLRRETKGEFRKQNVAELFHKGIIIDSSDWLNNPNNFKLALKSCDGSFHLVNSDVAEILADNSDRIKKRKLGDVIRELAPNDPIHGDRFLVYFDKDNNGFLLGNIETALMMLADA